MMVVVDAILVASRRTRRLNAPDQTFGDQHTKRVVHRLKRDGADLGPDDLGNHVSSDVGLTRYGAQDSQSLRRNLDTALSKEVRRVGNHDGMLDQILE